MSQDVNSIPWGAQDRFRAHYIVKVNGQVGIDELLAKTNLKVDGHFGTKKIVSVEWLGVQLAQILDSDEDLRKMIMKLSYKDAHIWVEPTKTGVRIHGKWKASYEVQVSKELFEVYNRIASHIKRKLGSPPI
jgi:hypothetical protein